MSKVFVVCFDVYLLVLVCWTLKVLVVSSEQEPIVKFLFGGLLVFMTVVTIKTSIKCIRR